MQFHDKKGGGIFLQAMTGLVFTGGCILSPICYLPLLWRRTVLVAGAIAVALLVGALSFVQSVGSFPVRTEGGVNWPFVIQYAVFLLAGVNVVALALIDCLKRKDAESLLLLLWTLGTFVFATFLNWSLNGRSILPMAPVVGILLARRIETHEPPERAGMRWQILVPLAPAALIALAVTWGDFKLAATARDAAAAIRASYASGPRTVWFQGHWGFQHYMELAGGKAVDVRTSFVERGDIVVIPVNSTNVHPLNPAAAVQVNDLQFMAGRWVSTMDHSLGAGFYSDLWGPLPFIFGPVEPEHYYIYVVNGSMPAWATLAPEGN
jgi:hypothetical protein